jgi:glucan phosphoethanolaminetransferase (alkaline phosphatase superfamily)
MKALAQIAVAFMPLILAGVFPFVQVLRGRRVWVAFAHCWVLLVAWMAVFSFFGPVLADQIGKDFGREVATNWMPEGPGVVAMAFFGWIYAGITVLLALIVKRVIQWSKQRKRSISK